VAVHKGQPCTIWVPHRHKCRACTHPALERSEHPEKSLVHWGQDNVGPWFHFRPRKDPLQGAQGTSAVVHELLSQRKWHCPDSLRKRDQAEVTPPFIARLYPRVTGHSWPLCRPYTFLLHRHSQLYSSTPTKPFFLHWPVCPTSQNQNSSYVIIRI